MINNMQRCLSLTTSGRLILRATQRHITQTITHTSSAASFHTQTILRNVTAASTPIPTTPNTPPVAPTSDTPPTDAPTTPTPAPRDDLPHAVDPMTAGAALLAGPLRVPTGAVAMTETPKGGKLGAPKTMKPKTPRLIYPLLGRIWRGSGANGRIAGTISPDDWMNIVKMNRRKMLQYKEKEQYAAFKNFRWMVEKRLEFLKEKGEQPSAEMNARIAEREAKIMEISKEAREAINQPVPPMPTIYKNAIKSARSIKDSIRAKTNPQHYLSTMFPTIPWRVFSFKLTHYHSFLLHKQMEKFREMAKKLGLSPSYPTYLPHRVKKFIIIRSPHVDKTSREQYETRLYSCKIHISPSPEKFWAIQRLQELSFRLINGAVRMRVETPPNVAIETFAFAPNPTKAQDGYQPPQLYAERDSPGIENIHYKFDQHVFPFLEDWTEEILDEKWRGIYPKDRDPNRPFPMRADLLAERYKHLRTPEDEAFLAPYDAQMAAERAQKGDLGGDEMVFDERGQFETQAEEEDPEDVDQIRVNQDEPLPTTEQPTSTTKKSKSKQ